MDTKTHSIISYYNKSFFLYFIVITNRFVEDNNYSCFRLFQVKQFQQIRFEIFPESWAPKVQNLGFSVSTFPPIFSREKIRVCCTRPPWRQSGSRNPSPTPEGSERQPTTSSVRDQRKGKLSKTVLQLRLNVIKSRRVVDGRRSKTFLRL